MDLDAIETRSEGRMNIAGGVFQVLEYVLDDVAESRGLMEKKDVEQLISELKEMLENGKPAEAEGTDFELALERACSILDAAYTAAGGNALLNRAVDETGSETLAQILSGAPDDEYLRMIDEEYSSGLKKEFEATQEFLESLDVQGNKRALGILKLVYGMFEDMREALKP